MSDLKEELKTVSGVGEATADAIMDVLSDHDTGDTPDEVHQALDYLDADRPGYAAKYLQDLVGD